MRITTLFERIDPRREDAIGLSIRVLMAALLFSVPVACSDVVSPRHKVDATARTAQQDAPQQKIYLFGAVLRDSQSCGSCVPESVPAAEGTFVLQLQKSIGNPDTYVARWVGEILNNDGNDFSIVGLQEENEDPIDHLLIALLDDPGDPVQCKVIQFIGETNISSDLGDEIISNPKNFEFIAVDGVTIRGTLTAFAPDGGPGPYENPTPPDWLMDLFRSGIPPGPCVVEGIAHQ
jgi:hypothetical protein